MKMNRYCEECLTRIKQHCPHGPDGKDNDTTGGGAMSTNQVCVWSADGESYEIRQDYIQTGTGGDGNRPSGLNFCPNYKLDPAQLPKAKSAKAIRDEFNAQRAANKAASKALKAEEKKLKAKARANDRKQKTKIKKDAKQKAKAVKRETLVVAQTTDDEDFSDLII